MSGGRILSIGEAMLELSPVQDALWRMGIAGDTLNTAWYLRRILGSEWRIGYLSRVGTDDFSRKMLDFLAAEGIESDHVSRDPDREIGLYAISLKNGERSFSYWRDTSAARHLADDPERLDRALQGCRLAYFSGITMAILDAKGRATLLDRLASARQAGSMVVFDPNLRPRLWKSADDMRDWTTKAAEGADLVLPSLDDEITHFADCDADATLSRYLQLGARQVVIKNAGGPIHFGGVEGTGSIDDLQTEVPVDTTAAGDSFNAAYLAAMLGGASPATAAAAGHELSRKVIHHRGALVREVV